METPKRAAIVTTSSSVGSRVTWSRIAVGGHEELRGERVRLDLALVGGLAAEGLERLDGKVVVVPAADVPELVREREAPADGGLRAVHPEDDRVVDAPADAVDVLGHVGDDDRDVRVRISTVSRMQASGAFGSRPSASRHSRARLAPMLVSLPATGWHGDAPGRAAVCQTGDRHLAPHPSVHLDGDHAEPLDPREVARVARVDREVSARSRSRRSWRRTRARPAYGRLVAATRRPDRTRGRRPRRTAAGRSRPRPLQVCLAGRALTVVTGDERTHQSCGERHRRDHRLGRQDRRVAQAPEQDHGRRVEYAARGRRAHSRGSSVASMSARSAAGSTAGSRAQRSSRSGAGSGRAGKRAELRDRRARARDRHQLAAERRAPRCRHRGCAGRGCSPQPYGECITRDTWLRVRRPRSPLCATPGPLTPRARRGRAARQPDPARLARLPRISASAPRPAASRQLSTLAPRQPPEPTSDVRCS